MPQMIIKIGIIFVLLLSTVKGQYSVDTDTIEDEINAIERALAENTKYEMHRRALEKIFGGLLNTVARDNDYYESLEDEEKRSIATLAKNGQLPSREPDTEIDSIGEDDNGHKRNIASMARTGMIGGKRNIQSLARQWQYGNGKRNIGSLMRNNMFPGSGKRNIASLARAGYGKRNVGTLARDWALPKLNGGSKYADEDGKRNIQSLKNSIKGRKKREIGGENELSEPVFQNGPIDYDELLQALNDDFPYAEKRFLASFESDTDNNDYDDAATTITSLEKRHLGALARSGWISSFRPIRNRFSRSGRTENMEQTGESFYQLDRLRPAPLVGTSCRRCEQDQQLSSNGMRGQWGFNDNNYQSLLGLSSAVRTRSGSRSRSPRITALNWRSDGRW